MKGNKGITLIALIVTIIVLIILAGVAITMIAGDSGILTNTTKAKLQTKVGEVAESIDRAAGSINMEIKTKTNEVSSDEKGYIATREGEFQRLAKELMKELKVKGTESATSINREGYTVCYVGETGENKLLGADAGVDDNEHIGYIMVTYSDNTIRSSLPKEVPDGKTYTVGAVKFRKEEYNPNSALMVYVVKVTNFGCELSVPTLTKLSAIPSDNIQGEALLTTVKKYAKFDYETTVETPETGGETGGTGETGGNP